jgi:protein-disulfide isomerase
MNWAIVSANVLAVVALALGAVALVLQFTEENGGGSTTAGANPTATARPTATPPTVVQVSVPDDAPRWGPEDAPVTIVEFSDFQCPYCARFVSQTYPQIKQNYEGKIRFVFLNFPLPATMHPNAQKAAEASECADDQGKFWEYHDLLFANQSALDAASLKSYAAQLGLDTATFNQCLDGGEKTAEVQKDSQDARSYGVGGTPAFFINGRLVSGAQPFSVFQQAIDAALKGGESGSAIPTVTSGSGG